MIWKQFRRHLADVEGGDFAERAIAEPVDDRRQVAAFAAVLDALGLVVVPDPPL